MTTNAQPWIVFGSELSPFTLKVLLLCQHVGLPYRFFPTEGSTLENLCIQFRLQKLLRRRLPLTWPQMTEDDEFPLVPFLFGPDGENLYDSSAIAEWLDSYYAIPDQKLIPDDPAAAFICRLIDDYADELGLYFAHHYRWKVSAKDNNAGRRLGHELRSLFGPVQRLYAGHFSARQVRRLPYLFSVAPEGYHIQGLPKHRQPPAPAGFPPTHALLENGFNRMLDCLETLLSQRRYLLGGRLTLADTAISGELSINMDDPSAAQHIRQRAPTVATWVEQLRSGHLPQADGQLLVDETLTALLAEICRTHVPLMQQNLAACEGWLARGETRFNELAFDEGKALYDGMLDGQPFRHVAKRFQARSWRDCRDRWDALGTTQQQKLASLLPAEHGLDRATQAVQLVT